MAGEVMLRKSVAFCPQCAGWVASHVADTEDERREALASAAEWHRRGDWVFRLEHPQRSSNPFARCACDRRQVRPPALPVIDWRAVEEGLPDSDETVVIGMPEADDEPVWLGYHDGEQWRDVSGTPLGDAVRLYAPMPVLPGA